MNYQTMIILAVSVAGLLFLFFGGVGWFLAKVDEFENHPHRD